MNFEVDNSHISVCMATYNGESYIIEQLQSIISELDQNDELIVIDDCSSDLTVQLVLSLNDPRIKLTVNRINLGHVKSFEKAILIAKNRYVFLADQDDIWTKGRVKNMLAKLLNPSNILVTGNSDFCDLNGDSIQYPVRGVIGYQEKQNFRNIIAVVLGESSYFGCTMAFSAKLKNIILPFPSFIESHDQWIAFAANIVGKNSHLDDVVLTRRIHNNNVSYRRRNLLVKLKTRVIQLTSIMLLLGRVFLIKVCRNVQK
ncbi:glycosyltransferase [Colwellia sp. BRX8-7]|jgi:glycosyltransferase involved in cell wall biosynthesis|uniref:glycosyltransferase n=1 Tax=Colwellia sp. BRX8-7 TaxID=2759833 RepID=UPI0015F4752D|nr:glycosyltransferase [Colwellia sp. BRX8-7]MBA6335655.1 glycosyltransferase [Colwellia sp. BRX8-7]